MTLHLTVNGVSYALDAPGLTPLLDILRERLVLTGAKPVCREGFCGACLVLIDDMPRTACLTPAGTVQGADIRTIEGLGEPGRPTPVQAALEAHDAVQCGMCFPGMVVTLTAFLAANPHPTRAALVDALAGNACRCTGYERIIEAALSLAGAA